MQKPASHLTAFGAKILTLFAIVLVLTSCEKPKSAESYNTELRRTADSISKYYEITVGLCDVYSDTLKQAISEDREFIKVLSDTYLEHSAAREELENVKDSIDESIEELAAEIPERSKESYNKILAFYNDYTEAHRLYVNPFRSPYELRESIEALVARHTIHTDSLRMANLLSPQDKQ